MKIEHVAIFTKDLEAMKAFYVKYFNGVANEKYYNANKGFESYFIRFGLGARLELMRKVSVVERAETEEAIGFSHLAFSLGSRDAVNSLTEELRSDGYSIISEPRLTGDGYYESCILDPEMNRIELTE